MTLLGGIVLGGVAVQALQAQVKPPVYVVAENDVIDPVALKDYAAKEDVLIKKHGGKPVALDGTPPKRFTVFVFDGMENMQAWQNEPSQDELRAIRVKASKTVSFAVEGIAN